jgi:hypothetical protein
MNRDRYLKIKSYQDITKLKWEEFEWFCTYLLEDLGYEKVKRVGEGIKGDGGKDIIAFRGNDKIYIECKRWNVATRYAERKLPVSKIRELGGVMARDGIKSGIFMITQPSYKKANDEAKQFNIKIYDESWFKKRYPETSHFNQKAIKHGNKFKNILGSKSPIQKHQPHQSSFNFGIILSFFISIVVSLGEVTIFLFYQY